MTRPAVFLDRDGVLIDGGEAGTDSAHTLAAVRILDGVAAALDALRAAGFELVVVTNQPDIARGRTTRAAVDAVHDHLRHHLGLHQVEVCPHDNADCCACRKPAPGMVTGAAARLGLDLSRSWLVGDRWVDIAAGAAAGLRTVLVERDYSWAASSSGAPDPQLVPSARADDLAAAVAFITTAG